MRSYTAVKHKINRISLAALATGILVAGCGQVSVQVGSDDVETPKLLTGSIPSTSDIAYTDVSPDDRQIIARVLDSVSVDLSNGSSLEDLTLPWLNATSGNSGTVSHIDPALFPNTGCLSFKTTANTITGIKLYAGTACRDISAAFAVTSLSVAEA
ncbi:RT0821/Lpp0805 family surface protein [Roseibium denhamense]|uniref:RT0821/Lpp0805 family surface protein n=1 Tax=Roseibium denhamense TaxID=76305 RepID=UPI001AD8DE05|nr:RT0821/Lpp0805 family surface protein [Roseibium denhamense]